MDFKGKKISIMGVGKSALACAKILYNLGAEIFLSDCKDEEKLKSILKDLDIPYTLESGGHTRALYQNKDLIIISPGVSIHHPLINEAKENAVKVLSEIELAYQMSSGPIIAVTGTNGKSTTTTLIYEMLIASHKKAYLAGNIGIPLISEIIKADRNSFLVTEISSFQLEGIIDFKPKIAIFLNITSDHLDRHKSFEEYLRMKARIFENQDKDDFAVLNADDSYCMKIAPQIKAQKFYFSRKQKISKGAYLEGQLIKLVDDELKEINEINLEKYNLLGVHNQENILAGFCAALILKLNLLNLIKVIKEFKALKHRLELAAEINGVKYIDDSKATNPGAVIAALKSFDEPIILIAGGKDKEMDFRDLGEIISKKVKALITIGESSFKIAQSASFFNFNKIFLARTLKEAVDLAYSISRIGDIVLLSPACASFDMFNSAEERGEIFKNLVLKLKEGS
ncbi:MAG: UDP-N-acetylmuramoyl-L-alanine--D-glutamate ligase [Armatimonadetes bacterium]|nr:UDP-N-acetylmuramoyl-L-alanine--D-glutamate ligase [Armatimonadota bacterium]